MRKLTTIILRGAVIITAAILGAIIAGIMRCIIELV